MNKKESGPAYVEMSPYYWVGLHYVSKFRRLREKVAREEGDGVPALIAGLVALGVADTGQIQKEISSMLGYDARPSVADWLEYHMGCETGSGLWRQRVDGSLALL